MSFMALAAVAAQFIGQPPVLVQTSAEGSAAALTEFVTLSVSPSGQVVGCEARLNNGAPVDDPDNCRRLRRVAMQPARDASGTPAPGVVTLMQSWGGRGAQATPAEMYLRLARLPTGLADRPVAALTLVVSGDGRVESCAVAKSTGIDALDRAACRSVGDAGVSVAADAGWARGERHVRALTVGFVPDAR